MRAYHWISRLTALCFILTVPATSFAEEGQSDQAKFMKEMELILERIKVIDAHLSIDKAEFCKNYPNVEKDAKIKNDAQLVREEVSRNVARNFMFGIEALKPKMSSLMPDTTVLLNYCGLYKDSGETKPASAAQAKNAIDHIKAIHAEAIPVFEAEIARLKKKVDKSKAKADEDADKKQPEPSAPENKSATSVRAKGQTVH